MKMFAEFQVMSKENPSQPVPMSGGDGILMLSADRKKINSQMTKIFQRIQELKNTHRIVGFVIRYGRNSKDDNTIIFPFVSVK
jgi:hypothetical protein